MKYYFTVYFTVYFILCEVVFAQGVLKVKAATDKTKKSPEKSELLQDGIIRCEVR